MKITNNAPAALFGAALGVTALTLGYALPAIATPKPGGKVWEACATTKVSDERRPDPADCDAKLIHVSRSGEMVTFAGGGVANIEALSFPHELADDSKVTFRYQGECGGGAPRVYVTLDGEVFHTGLADKPCGEKGEGSEWSTVTYTLPKAGTPKAATVGEWDVAAVGVVFDSGAKGEIVVTDLSIGDHQVDFKDRVRRPKPQPSDTVEPTPTPTASAPASPAPSTPAPSSPAPTVSATVDPGAGGGNNGGPSLPVTGPKVTILVIGGLVAAALGTAAVAAARRRKVNFEA